MNGLTQFEVTPEEKAHLIRSLRKAAGAERAEARRGSLRGSVYSDRGGSTPGLAAEVGGAVAREHILNRLIEALDFPDIYPAGLLVHRASMCAGEFCCFHNPSDHKMKTWPMNVRLDRFGALTERLCAHGVGHPDPDSLAYVESLHDEEDRGYEGVHGCDGCCHG